jgi:hypothetical protein
VLLIVDEIHSQIDDKHKSQPLDKDWLLWGYFLVLFIAAHH